MDEQSQSLVNTKEIKETKPTHKVADIPKYNLRCNRNLSEKMMKKDFVYDMRRPFQGAKKLQRREFHPNAIMPIRFSIVPKSSEFGSGGGDAEMLRVRRALNFQCNFCDEPIATLSSLSTHVKSHCRVFCKKCYWILAEGETIDKHNERAHPLSRK